MMKLFLAFCVSLSACAAHCFDITLKSGAVYKDVTVSTKTPDGVDIKSHKDQDVIVFRHIRYSDMSPESLKHFPDYNKPKADEHLTSIKAKYAVAQTKYAAKQADWIKRDEADEPITYPSIPPSWMVIKSTKEMKHGTIGWATTEAAEAGSKGGHFGKVYVYGLKLTEGNEWAGNLYPVSMSMEDGNEAFPCYTTSQDLADVIARRASGK